MHKIDIHVCAAQIQSVKYRFWPGAEDKALRGRNLSAVSRTLYRQEGEADLGLPSCAQPWRVENQSDKSTVPPPETSNSSKRVQKKNFSTKQSQRTAHFF